MLVEKCIGEGYWPFNEGNWPHMSSNQRPIQMRLLQCALRPENYHFKGKGISLLQGIDEIGVGFFLF